jgi:outer membrane protein assembly factor BamB
MATQGNVMTQNLSWYRTWLGVLGTSVLMPPLGLIFLWLRPFKKGLMRGLFGVVGRVAFSGLLVILTLVYLVALGFLHVESSGAGIIPIFSTIDPMADQAALEQHRAQMATMAPPASTAPADAAAASAPAASPGSTDGAASVAAATARAAPAASAYWSDFRGPNRAGIYTETPLLAAWPADGLKPLWKQPVGGGYASFTVANGVAFTIEQRRGNEVVAAYDLRSGRERWTNAWAALFSEAMGGDGPRATPVWDAGKIYALGAKGELRCLDAVTGKAIWSKNILSDNGAANIMWGMANSPLIVDDKVIVTPGGSRGRSVVAYNKLTGERIWGSLDDQAAYTSPQVVSLLGERQLLVVTASRMVGLRVETGERLWDFPWTTMYEINSAQPIAVDSEHVFVSAGYDHGAALVKIAKGERGYSATRVWENRNLKNRFNSSVLHEGHIYGFDESIFACIDARTGERKWKGGRYGYGQALLVYPEAAAGGGRVTGNEPARIIVITESGDLVLIDPSPSELKEMARFSAIEGKTWNHPALAEGILLVRNTREMAAFDLRAK